MLLLASNIKYLRKTKKVTLQDLGESVGVSHNAISNYENGKFFPTADVLVKICEFFDISADDFLLKDLSGGVEPAVFEPADLPSEEQGSNILVPVDEQSRYMGRRGKKYVRELTYVKIPNIEGDARTFEVSGNFMNPVLMAGDFVACIPSSLGEIKTGQIYVIVSNQINMGYFQSEQDRVLCIPGNKEEFEPFHIPANDIREVWEARVRLTNQISDPRLLYGNVERRMKVIEEFFKDKFSDIVLK